MSPFQFEFMRVSAGQLQTVADLDELGAEGWRLVTVLDARVATGWDVWVFQRESINVTALLEMVQSIRESL